MYVCILNQAGDMLVHQHMTSSPDALPRTIAPYRDDIVVAVECVFPWYWLAALCADQGLPWGLGHARALQALHGGQATHDKSASHKIAAWLRGGRLPHASVSPAQRRATRARLRRRMPRTPQRAALLAHSPKTTRQSPLPALGTKSAAQANRAGVAARVADAAVHTRIAVALALLPDDEARLRVAHAAASKPPGSTLPLPGLAGPPAPGSARCAVAGGSLPSLPSSASPGVRMVSLRGACSKGARQPRGNGTAPPALQSARPLAPGPVLGPPLALLFVAALGAHGLRGRRRPRAWHSRTPPARCAPPLTRTVGGHGAIARSQSPHASLHASPRRRVHLTTCGVPPRRGCAVIRHVRQTTPPSADNVRTPKAEHTHTTALRRSVSLDKRGPHTG
jgi:hypothetical protein